MRILFAGTPEIAVPSLRALSDSSHDVVGVLTAPDRARGRGRDIGMSPVKEVARELEIPTLQPDRLGSASRDMVSPLGPDILVVVAYGRIFGPKFLSLFPLGGINLHPSLLPRYRGPAPIPAAIAAGDRETGVTIQKLALEMDAGDVFSQHVIPLDGTETTGSLSEAAARIGAGLIVSVVDSIADKSADPRPQDHSQATYTALIRKSDGEIHWSAGAETIERAVRAHSPWPLSFTSFKNQRLSILRSAVAITDSHSVSGGTPGRVVRVDNKQGILVETGNGLLAIQELQLQARKALSWKNFLNGVTDFVGSVLGG